jgi:hypothetical protein
MKRKTTNSAASKESDKLSKTRNPLARKFLILNMLSRELPSRNNHIDDDNPRIIRFKQIPLIALR